MPQFYMTVGQKYARERHPHDLDPDGWVLIIAETLDEAREKAFDTYGNDWSMVYEEEDFDSMFYPMGCLAVIGKEVIQ